MCLRAGWLYVNFMLWMVLFWVLLGVVFGFLLVGFFFCCGVVLLFFLSFDGFLVVVLFIGCFE